MQKNTQCFFRSSWQILFACLFLLFGCLDKPLAVSNPCVQNNVVQRVNVDNIEKVDLLFLVDNSESMGDEQELLVKEIDRMVTVLTTGRLDPDVPCGGEDNSCTTDFNPVQDLNVAVVTSDMGAGEETPLSPNSVEAQTVCSQVTSLGDDGVFQRSTRFVPGDTPQAAQSLDELRLFASYRIGLIIIAEDFEARASDALKTAVGEIVNLLETNMLTNEARNENVTAVLESIEGQDGADKFSESLVGEIVDFATERTQCDVVDENTPNFLNFLSEEESGVAPDLQAFSQQFRCLARRGISGCALEQPMESVLKALTSSASNRRFRASYNPNLNSSPGLADGPNAGFLRDDALLAVIVVTDEDDCSIEDPFVTVPGAQVELSILDRNPAVDGASTIPGKEQDRKSFNFRCVDYPEALSSVRSIAQGLIDLKSDPSLVVFGLIAGVPQETVLKVNQSCSDDEDCYVDSDGSGEFTDDEKFGFCERFEGQNVGRCQHQFDTILSHPNMTPHEGFLGESPRNVVGSDEDPNIDENVEALIDTQIINRAQIMPSCFRGDGIDETGRLSFAIPPVRLVEVTKNVNELGGSGLVKSICDDDFRPALDAILEKIADVLAGTCLPRALNQNAEGKVNCEVVEILPAQGDVTQCSQIANRGREAEAIRTVEEDGVTRQVCLINQLSPPQDPEDPDFGGERGWYYDNESEEVLEACGRFITQQRIAFSVGASPEEGSTIRLECAQPVVGESADQVLVGSPCTADRECKSLSEIENDPSAICDPGSLTCQYNCEVDSECKAAGLSGYRCDTRTSHCVNPICIE